MEQILQLIEGYGLPLVLLLGALYALYRFLVFSLYEVKNQFSRHHERAADNIEEMKKKIDIILEFIKQKIMDCNCESIDKCVGTEEVINCKKLIETAETAKTSETAETAKHIGLDVLIEDMESCQEDNCENCDC